MTDTDLSSFLLRADGFVPKARYTSAAFAALEADRLWGRVWQVACRAEEIPNVGDFAEYEIGDQSVLVVRSSPEHVDAFHNVCLHRGSKLATGYGNVAGTFRCPFHGWRYACDGRLEHVVDEHEFGMLPNDLRIPPVRVDCWAGFVFVNLDRDAEPLLDFLQPLPELLAPYHLDELRLRAYRTTIIGANWKAVVDAFNEGYHVQTLHEQILPWTDDVGIAYEQIGKHSHYGRLPGARRTLQPSPRLGLRDDEYDEGAILAGLVTGLGGAFLADERALVDELRAAQLPRGELLPEFQRRRMRLLAERGLDVSGFEAEQMTSAEDVYTFPNLVGPIYPGSAILFRVRPNGANPDSCIKDTWVLEWPRADATARPLERRFYADWRERAWGLITEQDYANLERVQAGMKSTAFDGLRLNPRQESNIAHMHRVIDAYLTRPS